MTLQAKLIALLIALVAGLASGAGLYYYAYRQGELAATQRCDKATAQLKQEASTTLATETAKTRAAELALQANTHTQELQDAKNQKTVSDLSDRLRRAAGQSDRLRDPNATGCGGGGGGTPGAAASAAGAGADDRAETGGLLSAELSGLLRARLREADDINTAYASCRADALSVRGVVDMPK